MKTIFDYQQEKRTRVINHNPHNHDFSCVNCHHPVSASALISRVQNRNHCPYCLWSRHLDLYQPGDRLSACKAGMHPIGLAFKRERNRYSSSQGELMIVHQCSECGKFSLNRSAADDNPDLILALPKHSAFLKAEVIMRLEQEHIELVLVDRINEIRRRLEGSLSFQGIN